ncbi:MAG TPA: hypothetical protein VGL91_25280 [Acidobacteriota bacterium]|jgi:hypothetical protein
MKSKKIGLIVGREGTFPQAFINRVNQLNTEGVTAEFVKLGGTGMAEPCPYGCIVDRMSHEVKYYRGYLKNAVLSGTYIINNPFWWSADDKFFNYSLATRLGVAVPRTILLPSKSYPPDVWPESLRNLVYPIDWDAIVDYIRLPAILKPFEGGGWKNVYKVDSKEELLRAYDQTGELCMTLQQFIHFDHYVRCFCIGKENITPVKYDPHNRCYLVEHDHLSAELGERIMRDAQTLNRALGYDMNTVEFAVQDGIPYAIDFMNPAPDMDRYSITDFYFELMVDQMARLAIERTLRGTFADMQPRWPELTRVGSLFL